MNIMTTRLDLANKCSERNRTYKNFRCHEIAINMATNTKLLNS